MATALADIADVTAAMGRDLTPEENGRAQAILDKLSALFRTHSERTFTPATSTVRLMVRDGGIWLPERPVVSVASIADDDGVAVTAYTRIGAHIVTDLAAGTFLTITYSHGDADVPDLVRLTVAEAARRALLIPDEASAGANSHTLTTGSITEQTSFAPWAQGGQAMLSPDDIATARRFRMRTPRVIVQQG